MRNDSTSRDCDAIVYIRSNAPSHVERFVKLAAALSHLRFVAVYGGLPEWAMETLDKAAKKHRNIKLQPIGFDFGKGAALRAGIASSSAAFIALVDVEGEVNPADIESLSGYLASARGIDGVIGDRWANRNSVASRRRRLSSRFFSLFACMLFGLRVNDIQSPLKVFRSDALFKVFEDLRLLNAGFDTELLYHAHKRKISLHESSIRWEAPREGLSLFATGLHAGLALLTLRALEARLPGIPLLRWLGRKYVIPAKSRYKILILSWRDPLHASAGGGEAYLYEQARLWASSRQEVTWFAQRVAGRPANELLDGIKIVRRGRVPSVFLAAAYWYLTGSPRDYDFILDCMNGIPFFSPLFSTKPKVCLVHHLHKHHFREELPWPLSIIAEAIESKLVPAIYHRTPFITVSDSTRADMEKNKISRLPIKLVHNGVSSDLVPGKKATAPTVLYLGRLRKYKRVRKLIDSFALLKISVPDARLVIAGTGDDEDDLRTYVLARNLCDVEFTGRVNESEKVRLMQEAWVFGMPSSIEGWGVVVIEANSCATPAVAYDVAGLRDCIRHGVTGFLAADDDDFTRRLASLLTDADVRNDISARAAAWAANFSWRNTAQSTLDQIRLAQPWQAAFEDNGIEGWRFVPHQSAQSALSAIEQT
jgi:glycosyltransferase involved in cell wall biosynthesis